MKVFKVKFLVQGWVEQEIEVDDQEITKEDLENLLETGTICTSIEEKQEIVHFSGKKIGTVISVDNNCEYTDFSVKEN